MLSVVPEKPSVGAPLPKCSVIIYTQSSKPLLRRPLEPNQDVPLNDNCRHQARLTAAALQRQTIDAAYTSPLSRASETAQIMLEPHNIAATHHKARPPGGTTLREIFERCFPMMVECAKRHEGGTVALFSHRVVNKLLVIGALGLKLQRFPFIVQGNCSISEFLVHDGEFTIETLNNTSHMVEGGVDVLDADF